MIVDEKNSLPDGEKISGAWAAIKNNRVISVISMKVPSYVDFEKYRSSAQECLGYLGDVRSGDLYRDKGSVFFVKRKGHASRNGGNKSEAERFLVDLG